MGGGGSKAPELAMGNSTYRMERLVGKGSYGRVHSILDQNNGQRFCVKILDKGLVLWGEEGRANRIIGERKLLSSLSHPSVVKLYGSFQDEKNLYMVLEFMWGGELAFYLKKGPLKEEDAAFYTANILLGVECLHKNQIIHRDLKPENVLISANGYAKLTDFNMAVRVDEDYMASGICGTSVGLAPEMYKEEKYSFSVDIWGVGIIAYHMAFGRNPYTMKPSSDEAKWLSSFDCKDPKYNPRLLPKTFFSGNAPRILREKVDPPPGSSPSPLLLSFLNSILTNKNERTTLEDAQNHEWLGEWKGKGRERIEREEIEKPPIRPRTDRPNLSKNIEMDGMAVEGERKKKKKITEEDQRAFEGWDWLCEELMGGGGGGGGEGSEKESGEENGKGSGEGSGKENGEESGEGSEKESGEENGKGSEKGSGEGSEKEKEKESEKESREGSEKENQEGNGEGSGKESGEGSEKESGEGSEKESGEGNEKEGVIKEGGGSEGKVEEGEKGEKKGKKKRSGSKIGKGKKGDITKNKEKEEKKQKEKEKKEEKKQKKEEKKERRRSQPKMP